MKVAKLVLLPTVVAKLLVWLSMLAWTWWSNGATLDLSQFYGSFIHWDAVHYLYIAENGYPPYPNFHDGFLPGFPIVVRVVQLVFQDPTLSGLVVTTLSTFLALLFIYRWLAFERDESEAKLGIWVVALWPMAVFLSLPYTEAPFLAAAAATIYYGRRGDLAKAGIAGAVGACMRVFGLALIPFLVVQFWQKYKQSPRIALTLLPAIPLELIFLYFRIHTGDANAYLDAQSGSSFNHHLDWPISGLLSIWPSVTSAKSFSVGYVFGLEVLFGVTGFLVCIALWFYKQFPRPLAIYCSAVWVMATSLSFWLSVPRYELAMFPAVLPLIAILRKWPLVRFPLFAVLGATTIITAMVFASGWWIG